MWKVFFLFVCFLQTTTFSIYVKSRSTDSHIVPPCFYSSPAGGAAQGLVVLLIRAGRKIRCEIQWNTRKQNKKEKVLNWVQYTFRPLEGTKFYALCLNFTNTHSLLVLDHLPVFMIHLCCSHIRSLSRWCTNSEVNKSNRKLKKKFFLRLSNEVLFLLRIDWD